MGYTARRLNLHVRAKVADDGVVEFIASTPSVDRAGDVLEPNWELGAFQRNPVILYAHDNTALPIGKAEYVGMDGDNLKIGVRFLPREVDEFAWKVQECYRRGFLNAVSVGFIPLEMETRKEGRGFRIERSELLEVSAVPVPMNADALISGRSGIKAIFDESGTKPTRPTSAINVALVRAFMDGSLPAPTVAATARYFTITKADPPMTPAEDPEGAADDPAAMCDEIMRLLTPTDGRIAQENYDAAMALLGKLKASLADEGEPETDEEPETGGEPPMNAAIDRLTTTVNALAKVVSAMQTRSDDEDWNIETDPDPVEEVLSDPEALARLATHLGG